MTSPYLALNPFLDTSVGEAELWGARDWLDVPQIHAAQFAELSAALNDVRCTRRTEVRFVRGPGGSGKSHLFARLRRQFADTIFYAYAPNPPLQTGALEGFVLSRLIASLRQPARLPGGAPASYTQLRLLAYALIKPVIEQNLPMHELHEAWAKIPLEERKQLLHEAVLLLEADHPQMPRSALRTLLTVLREDKEHLAAQWLAGATYLTEAELKYLGVTEPLRQEDCGVVIQLLGRLAGQVAMPFVLVLDQLDLVATPAQMDEFQRLLFALIDQSENWLVFIGLVVERFTAWEKEISQALRGRIGIPDSNAPFGFRLPVTDVLPIASAEKKALLSSRLRSRALEAQRATDRATSPMHPLTDDEVNRLTSGGAIFPRHLLAAAAEAYTRCASNGAVSAPAAVTAAGAPPPAMPPPKPTAPPLPPAVHAAIATTIPAAPPPPPALATPAPVATKPPGSLATPPPMPPPMPSAPPPPAPPKAGVGPPPPMPTAVPAVPASVAKPAVLAAIAAAPAAAPAPTAAPALPMATAVAVPASASPKQPLSAKLDELMRAAMMPGSNEPLAENAVDLGERVRDLIELMAGMPVEVREGDMRKSYPSFDGSDYMASWGGGQVRIITTNAVRNAFLAVMERLQGCQGGTLLLRHSAAALTGQLTTEKLAAFTQRNVFHHMPASESVVLGALGRVLASMREGSLDGMPTEPPSTRQNIVNTLRQHPLLRSLKTWDIVTKMMEPKSALSAIIQGGPAAVTAPVLPPNPSTVAIPVAAVAVPDALPVATTVPAPKPLAAAPPMAKPPGAPTAPTAPSKPMPPPPPVAGAKPPPPPPPSQPAPPSAAGVAGLTSKPPISKPMARPIRPPQGKVLPPPSQAK